MGFEPYTEPTTPTEVTKLVFEVTLEMIDELDNEGVPTGQRIEQRSVYIRALVSDQNGVIQWDERGDHNTITNQSLLTAQQVQDVQNIMTSFKTNVEGKLLSP